MYKYIEVWVHTDGRIYYTKKGLSVLNQKVYTFWEIVARAIVSRITGEPCLSRNKGVCENTMRKFSVSRRKQDQKTIYSGFLSIGHVCEFEPIKSNNNNEIINKSIQNVFENFTKEEEIT